MQFVTTDNYFYFTTANMVSFSKLYGVPKDFGTDFRRGELIKI